MIGYIGEFVGIVTEKLCDYFKNEKFELHLEFEDTNETGEFIMRLSCESRKLFTDTFVSGDALIVCMGGGVVEEMANDSVCNLLGITGEAE